MEENKDLELLDRYLRGMLTEEELAEVTHRLKDDLGFQEQLVFLQTVQTSLAAQVAEDLRAELRLEEELHHRTQLPTRFWWAAAATVLLLLAVGLILRQALTPPLPSQLASAAFSPYPNVLHSTLRGEGNTQFAWELHYARGEYPKAIKELEALLDLHPDSIALYLYTGVCHLATEKPKTASSYLERVASTTDPLSLPAKWYLALSELQLEQVGQAKELLEGLSLLPNAAPYDRKAAELLEALP